MPKDKTKLSVKPFKPAKTYKSGYLDVGEGHQIYYELSGNPKGKPVLYIHGGPGGGFSENAKKFFNPKVYNMIHFDQRGSGKSKPFASIKHNTTAFLVRDMKNILDFLGIKKVILFGGSWGSTLSLVFAITYPHMVKAMVLRGIFLASKKENDYFTYESKAMYPEVWNKFASLVPEKVIRQRKIEEYYYSMITHSDKKIRDKFTLAWAEFEFSLSKLRYSKEYVEESIKEVKPDAFSTIELHYLVHKCFLPEDFILKNAAKISHIPTALVQGRYDCVCSPSAAYALHKKMKNSKIYFTISGHSSGDLENETQLIAEMKKLEKMKF
ncbi:MAG TPA: prolyl aminopeptidase [Candidatus Nanoarchaeia archaeon]|nr:prolyl aminopeptidase [Candidatus Nanoarchaeia archaeon]